MGHPVFCFSNGGLALKGGGKLSGGSKTKWNCTGSTPARRKEGKTGPLRTE